MLGWLRAAASRIPFVRNRVLSLVANWLAGQLWLLDTSFYTLARKAFGANAVVYACLRLKSQSIPEAPLRPYQEEADGTRTELDRDHPLYHLIRRPNELMTEYEFWELTTLHMDISGHAFWWKERSNAGELLSLWPLRPDRVAPVYSTSEKAGERLLAGWSYQDPGTGEFVPIPRRDVLAFNFPSPAGAASRADSGGIVEGIGPLQVLASEISADNEATGFVGGLLRNYATPSMLIKLKAGVRNEEEARLIKAKAAAEFGGENRGRVGLVDGDAEVQMTGFNLEQLEFPDLRAIAETRISAAIGVPAILVGLKAGLDRATYSNAAEARRYFAETTLGACWRRYADQYTADVAAEFGPGIVCLFDTSQVLALASQRTEQMQPVKDGFKDGAVTVNEYRAALGLPRLAGGDVRVIPATMIEMMAEVEEIAAKAVRSVSLPCPTCGERNLSDGIRYDPSQPRDSEGKFGSEGGHGGGSGDRVGAGDANGRTFKDIKESKDYLTSTHADWRKSLTAKEDAAMNFYQSPGYTLMNGQLRGHAVDAPAKDLARAKDASKNLSVAIAKAPPLKEPLIVYRGFSADQFGKLSAGSTITDKAFTSTSLVNDVGAYGGGGGKGAAHATIRLPAGIKAAAGSTKELILPPGTSFKVLSIGKSGKTTNVELEAIL